MRIASLTFIAIVSVSCGQTGAGSREPGAVAHQLVGTWNLRREPPSGIRLSLRVDSVVADSAHGALTFYMAGDAGFAAPDAWGPLAGTLRRDSVFLLVRAGARTPALALDGIQAGDTIPVHRFAMGDERLPGAWALVRER